MILSLDTLSRIFGHPVDPIRFWRWVGWNLLLAVIPVALGYGFLALNRGGKAKGDGFTRLIAAALIFGAWLAFVPNTCYLLTEWRHFMASVMGSDTAFGQGGHPWLRLSTEAGFFLVYSGLGALCFVLAIRPVERVLQQWRTPFPVLALPLFLLISLGVYLGLVLRLNSWNIVTHPDHVVRSILALGHNQAALISIGVFALFLWGLYEGLDVWVDGMMERWGRWTVALRKSGSPAPAKRSAPSRKR